MRRRMTTLAALAALLLVTVPTLAPDVPELTVVINEICWAGAEWDQTAEWIELFNTTNAPIDLAGWQLISSDGAPHIRLRGVIQPRTPDAPASGYFLLERGSDESVPGIAADLVYQGALTNLGESLTLIDPSGRIIDTANLPRFSDLPRAWSAGSDNRGALPFATMERVQFQREDDPANWASCIVSDVEHSLLRIAGTPKLENSVYNALPTAQWVATPAIPHPGLSAEFDATESSDANDSIVSYLWEFGDGTNADGPLVSHAFSEAGEYEVTLLLTDSKGGQTRMTHTVQVAWTTPPVADFSVVLKSDLQVARVGDRITFQDESSDIDSEIVSWKWHFGDGQEDGGRLVTHSYEAYGQYVVGLRVTDMQGEVGIQTQSVSIASRLPVAVFTVSPERPNQFQTVHFDASDSFDPDGEIVLYQWDFDGDGVIEVEGAEPTASHEYTAGGRFSPRLYVLDNASDIASRERVVDINAAPVAQFQISSFEPQELEPVILTDLSYDADGVIVQWSWSFGDETFSNEPSPTHVYQAHGATEVSLAVTDERGATGTAVATIQIGNLPPVAVLTAAATTLPTGTAFSFDASGSFDPSPQGSLTRFEWDLGSGNGFELETSGPHLSYAFDENGSHTIRVRVTDSDDASAISDPVSITVSNRPPTVSRVTWSPGNPVDGETVLFTAHASDQDGEIIGWTWALGSESAGSTQLFSHAFQDDGSYPLSIRVRDDDGASSDPYSVTVTVHNAAPVAKMTAVQGSICGVSSVRFDASESYDPSPTGRIVHVAWDFGDGTSCPGSSSGCSETERWTPVHCYSASGPYIVTLVVIDEHGALSSTQKTILIGE